MADSKLTALGTVTTLADGDLVYVVDVSDTTDDPAGSSKGITKANLATALGPTENVIFTGTKTASQNINGAEGTEVNVTWDVSSQDTGEVTSFTSGDSTVQITNAGWINIHASVIVNDSAANNRTIIMISLVHNNASDVEQYTYRGDVQYNRDDAAAYDSSGGCIDKSMMYVAAGDKLIIQTRILDDGTSTSNIFPDTTYSKIRIARIEF
jgi:hypothetical protein